MRNKNYVVTHPSEIGPKNCLSVKEANDLWVEARAADARNPDGFQFGMDGDKFIGLMNLILYNAGLREKAEAELAKLRGKP